MKEELAGGPDREPVTLDHVLDRLRQTSVTDKQFTLPDSGVSVRMRKPSFKDMADADTSGENDNEIQLAMISAVSFFDGEQINYRELKGALSAMDYLELLDVYRSLTEKAKAEGKPVSSEKLKS